MRYFNDYIIWENNFNLKQSYKMQQSRQEKRSAQTLWKPIILRVTTSYNYTRGGLELGSRISSGG